MLGFRVRVRARVRVGVRVRVRVRFMARVRSDGLTSISQNSYNIK